MNFYAFSRGTCLLSYTKKYSNYRSFCAPMRANTAYSVQFSIASVYQCSNSSNEAKLWYLWVLLGNVIDEEDCCWASIECLDDGSERFHPSSIPNLHFNTIILVHLDFFGVKLDSKSSSVAVSELIFGEPVQQTTFSHSWRSNNDHFESLFLLLLHTLPELLLELLWTIM